MHLNRVIWFPVLLSPSCFSCGVSATAYWILSTNTFRTFSASVSSLNFCLDGSTMGPTWRKHTNSNHGYYVHAGRILWCIFCNQSNASIHDRLLRGKQSCLMSILFFLFTVLVSFCVILDTSEQLSWVSCYMSWVHSAFTLRLWIKHMAVLLARCLPLPLVCLC